MLNLGFQLLISGSPGHPAYQIVPAGIRLRRRHRLHTGITGLAWGLLTPATTPHRIWDAGAPGIRAGTPARGLGPGHGPGLGAAPRGHGQAIAATFASSVAAARRYAQATLASSASPGGAPHYSAPLQVGRGPPLLRRSTGRHGRRHGRQAGAGIIAYQLSALSAAIIKSAPGKSAAPPHRRRTSANGRRRLLSAISASRPGTAAGRASGYYLYRYTIIIIIVGHSC